MVHVWIRFYRVYIKYIKNAFYGIHWKYGNMAVLPVPYLTRLTRPLTRPTNPTWALPKSVPPPCTHPKARG